MNFIKFKQVKHRNKINMITLLDFSPEELKSQFMKDGLPAYRSAQVFNWIYKKFVYDFETMSDLPKILRLEFKNIFELINLTLKDYVISEGGETIKFLFETKDNQLIESVLILDDNENPDEADTRITLCVSSQAGCPLGCKFCATGLLGFKRNLTISEIVSEVLLAENFILNRSNDQNNMVPWKNTEKLPARKISNIVFMGMGEPLLNYENVIKSIKILNISEGYNLGSRHFTISTAGLTKGIEALAAEKLQVRLAVSLHTADQSIREKLMPYAEVENLDKLVSAIGSYQAKTDRRITFEYILIEGENSGDKDVSELKKLLKGLDYNLNVIEYNPVEGIPYLSPGEKTIIQFTNSLKKHSIPYVFRRSKGRNIKAGCGQLGLYWKNLGFKS